MFHDIAAALPWSRQLSQLKATTKQLQNYLKQDQVYYILRGKLAGAPELEIDIYFEGPQSMLADVERLLFSESLLRKNLSLCGYSTSQVHEVRSTCDISFTCIKPWGRIQNGAFPFKFWLNAKKKITANTELKLPKDFRRALQKVQNEQYQINKTKDFSIWQQWLETMVIPTAKLRHGEQMALPSLDEMRGLMGEAELIMISHEGQWLAGALVYLGRLNRNLFVWRVGMSELGRTDAKLYKSLNVYLDYLAYQEAHEKKAEWFNLGPTLARVDGGLYRYKTSWGCGFYDDPTSPEFALQFHSTKVSEILFHVPLITLEQGQSDLHFAEKNSAEPVSFIPNLNSLYYHTGDVYRQMKLDAPDDHI